MLCASLSILESALAQLAKGGDLTRWGLSNAITRIASDAVNYDRAVELEKVGGAIALLDETNWTQIASAN